VQPATACVVVAQQAGIAWVSQRLHRHPALLQQRLAQRRGALSGLQRQALRQCFGQAVQRVDVVVAPVEEVPHLLVRQRRGPGARLAGAGVPPLFAVEAVDELRMLVLQALVALVQRHIGLGQLGRLLDEPGKLRGLWRLVAQRTVVQRSVQLGQQALVLLLGELRHIAAEYLGQLQQHGGRHGALVGLDLRDVAQRQLQPSGELGLVPAQLLAQSTNARPDEEFAARRFDLCKVRRFHYLLAK
jgi:hypothetical protein